MCVFGLSALCDLKKWNRHLSVCSCSCMDNMEYSLELLLNKLSHKTNMPLNAKCLKPKAVSYHFKDERMKQE